MRKHTDLVCDPTLFAKYNMWASFGLRFFASIDGAYSPIWFPWFIWRLFHMES